MVEITKVKFEYKKRVKKNSVVILSLFLLLILVSIGGVFSSKGFDAHESENVVSKKIKARCFIIKIFLLGL